MAGPQGQPRQGGPAGRARRRSGRVRGTSRSYGTRPRRCTSGYRPSGLKSPRAQLQDRRRQRQPQAAWTARLGQRRRQARPQRQRPSLLLRLLLLLAPLTTQLASTLPPPRSGALMDSERFSRLPSATWGGEGTSATGDLSLAPSLGGPKGTDTADPRTSPGVRSDQNPEANPAVATRAFQDDQRYGIGTFFSSEEQFSRLPRQRWQPRQRGFGPFGLARRGRARCGGDLPGLWAACRGRSLGLDRRSRVFGNAAKGPFFSRRLRGGRSPVRRRPRRPSPPPPPRGRPRGRWVFSGRRPYVGPALKARPASRG